MDNIIVGSQDQEELANIIYQNLKAEFSLKHLSKNLINTIRIERGEGQIKIIIPAKVYDMRLYQKEGILVFPSNDSYASEIDINGSSIMLYNGKRIKTGNHKGFLDRIINQSIEMWMLRKKINAIVEG